MRKQINEIKDFLPTLLSPQTPTLASLLQGRIPHKTLLQIHAKLYRNNTHQDNLTVTRLIGHYPAHTALKVFNQLTNPNIFPFNATIRVLAQEGHFTNTFHLFKLLKTRALHPNDLTFSVLLKACFRADDVFYAKQIHTHVLKSGWGCDCAVLNGVLGVYGKGFKDVESARKVFDEIPDKRLVSSWSCLVFAFAKSGRGNEVLRVFCSMVRDYGVRPDDDLMVNVFSACSGLEFGQVEEWARVLEGVGDGAGCDWFRSVLVYLYGKLGRVEECRGIFDKISDDGKRSVLPWNAMVGAYAQNGCALEALRVFRVMLDFSICRPNHVTMVSVLSACAEVGDLDLGVWVHEYMRSHGKGRVIESNAFLATAFIDMYLKCGSLDRAKDVFDRVANKDVILFNSMIMGLGLNGKGEEALRLFSRMREFGLHPNAGTYLGALCACSHSGFLEKGCQIFQDMKHTVPPRLEHYTCYIDLLSRAGQVEEALKVASSMPFQPNNFVWGSLLCGCLLHSRVDMARELSKRLVRFDPENSAGYVMLSNAFAVNSQWGNISGLRGSMREMGVKKQPGCSWISVNGAVHEFLVGCLSHPKIISIKNTLEILSKEMIAVTC